MHKSNLLASKVPSFAWTSVKNEHKSHKMSQCHQKHTFLLIKITLKTSSGQILQNTKKFPILHKSSSQKNITTPYQQNQTTRFSSGKSYAKIANNSSFWHFKTFSILHTHIIFSEFSLYYNYNRLFSFYTTTSTTKNNSKMLFAHEVWFCLSFPSPSEN